MFYFQTAQLSKMYWLSACGTRTDGASHFTELQNVVKTFLKLPELYVLESTDIKSTEHIYILVLQT